LRDARESQNQLILNDEGDLLIRRALGEIEGAARESR
jgi:hypothetical protein